MQAIDHPEIRYIFLILLVFGPTLAAMCWPTKHGRRRLLRAAWITAVWWGLLALACVWFVYSYNR